MSDFGGGGTGPAISTSVTVPDTATLARIKTLEDAQPVQDARTARIETITGEPGEVIANSRSIFTPFGELENITGNSVTLDATDPQTLASMTGAGLTPKAGVSSYVYPSTSDPDGLAAPADKTIATFGEKLYTKTAAGLWKEFKSTAGGDWMTLPVTANKQSVFTLPTSHANPAGAVVVLNSFPLRNPEDCTLTATTLTITATPIIDLVETNDTLKVL